MAAQAFGLCGYENGADLKGLHKNGVAEAMKIARTWRLAEQVFAARIGRESEPAGGRSKPALAVKIGENDAAPVDVLRTRGVAINLDAHHHAAVLLDAANRAERDVV